MRQWSVPVATPRTEPLPGCLSVSPPPAEVTMECCEVEPRYTIEQIDLLQRLRLSGMTKPQIIHALESLERLDPDTRPAHCDANPAPSQTTATTTAPTPLLHPPPRLRCLWLPLQPKLLAWMEQPCLLATATRPHPRRCTPNSGSSKVIQL
ncbi:hypothetical protein WMY93_019281 [Mugilogobius chulae]|uniref:HNF-p1 domain-containing protein n=1 Tax=Mugilogobius chulae TaxID=88201 RepID=A0AAW0NGM8_9GOBI